MKLSKKIRILRGAGALRVKMGVSQEVFGQYLGISKSMVSMVENGHRSFPFHALKKLSEMEIALAAREGEVSILLPVPVRPISAQQQTNRESKQRIRRLDLSRGKYQLKMMLEKYDETLLNFSHIQLAKNIHGQREGSQEQRAMERGELQLHINLRHCNKEQQAKLEGRIARLEILIAAQEPIPVAVGEEVKLTYIDTPGSALSFMQEPGNNIEKILTPSPGWHPGKKRGRKAVVLAA